MPPTIEQTITMHIEGVSAWRALTAAGELSEEFATAEEALASVPLAELPEGEEPLEEQESPEALPARWEGTVILEGHRTTDDREIAPDALNLAGERELPLPLMCMTETGWGHEDARLCGNVDTLERRPRGEGENEIYGAGDFDLNGEDGQEAARLVRDGILRWVSADIAATNYEIIEEGDCPDFDDVDSPADIPTPDECRIIERITAGEIMGVTLVPFPAFPEATIQAMAAAGTLKLDRFHSQPLDLGGVALTASVAAPIYTAPVAPPEVFFEDPSFKTATPVTLTREGRTLGHIAAWNVCHTGFADACLMAPHSMAAYAYFLTGSLETQEDELVRVGQLTMGCGHADLSLGYQAAASHYDGGPGAVQWADVTVGEDSHGIWFSGAIRPGLTEAQRREAMAQSLSGDWRRIGGSLELMAALSVPVPGFPVVTASGDVIVASSLPGARVRVEDGDCTALVAAGCVRPERTTGLESLARRVALLEAQAAALRPMAASALRDRLRPPLQ